MNKKLKVGVIGLGMGRNHVRMFQEHDGAEVIAIADPAAEKLEEIGDLYNVPNRYEDAVEMLRKEDLDIAAIATPNKFHKPLTISAFKAGCHVFCEKPMAMTGQEAQAMLTASKRAGKRLMINFSYRFTQQAWALKKQVKKGILGDIYFARTIWHRRRGLPGFGGWFGQKSLAGGGPLIDLGVHRLDLALWLMDYPQPTWVMGNTQNAIANQLAKKQGKLYDVEDFACAMIHFDNDASIELEASWATNIPEKEWMETRLLGTKAGLVQKNKNGSYEFEAEIYMEDEGNHFDMRLAEPLPPSPTPCGHFVDAILNNEPHIATGEEGLIVMRILDAVYASARRGAPVKIKASPNRPNS